MGLLDGGGAALMASVLGGVYLDAELYRPAGVGDDGEGGGEDSGFGEPEAVKAQLEACTEAMREAATYTDLDVRILVLANGVARPDSDCQIKVDGTTYGINAPIGRDPAGCYWDLHGRPA
jgi:hypothetical protein